MANKNENKLIKRKIWNIDLIYKTIKNSKPNDLKYFVDFYEDY